MDVRKARALCQEWWALRAVELRARGRRGRDDLLRVLAQGRGTTPDGRPTPIEGDGKRHEVEVKIRHGLENAQGLRLGLPPPPPPPRVGRSTRLWCAWSARAPSRRSALRGGRAARHW